MKSTIVVVVRERFSPFVASLKSLFDTVPCEVPVVVVDCGCPEDICAQLAELQRQRPFDWIHTDYLLLPHEARNRALGRVSTEYVVFADNDLHYEAGWLHALEANADGNHADVVAPLIYIGPPIASKIHHAGGELMWKKDGMHDYLEEIHRLANQPLQAGMDFANVAPLSHRGVEFHCFLVRRAALDKTGGLDERLITSEHIDFILRCLLLDFKMTFEQRAVVTYMAKVPFTWRDFDYFFFRWSLDRVEESTQILKTRWGVPIKHPRHYLDWPKGHQQRAVLTFFPDRIRRKVSDRFLMGLMKPLRFFNVMRAEWIRRRRIAAPFTAPLPSGYKPDLLRQWIQ